MGGSPVPGVALRQVHVGGEGVAAGHPELRHRLRQARGAVGGDEIAEALRVALHRPGGAHQVARGAEEVGQHGLAVLEEGRGVTAADAGLAAEAEHQLGVWLAEEVLVAVADEARGELEGGGEGAGADEGELRDGVADACRAVAGGQVGAALEEAEGGEARGKGGVVAEGVTVVEGQWGPRDEGGEEGGEMGLERRDGVVLPRRAAGVDEGGSSRLPEEEETGEEDDDVTVALEEHVAT